MHNLFLGARVVVVGATGRPLVHSTLMVWLFHYPRYSLVSSDILWNEEAVVNLVKLNVLLGLSVVV